MAEGYGAELVRHPELVADMVRQARERTGLPVSVKCRVCQDPRETVEYARRAESAGAAWITVHGRTPKQRMEPVNVEAIKLVRRGV